MGHLSFHCCDFLQSPDITLAAVEPCREERPDQVGGKGRADDLRAEAEDVHVVVLDALVRGVDVVGLRVYATSPPSFQWKTCVPCMTARPSPSGSKTRSSSVTSRWSKPGLPHAEVISALP